MRGPREGRRGHEGESGEPTDRDTRVEESLPNQEPGEETDIGKGTPE